MKTFQKILSLFGILIIVFCTGCSQSEDQSTETFAPTQSASPRSTLGNPSPTPVASSDNNGTDSTNERIELYISQISDSNFKDFISKNLWDVKIVEEVTSETLNAEMIAGKGPDIFIFNSDSLLNYRSFLERGAFADLNEWIGKDTDFDLSQYHSVVFDSGMYQGERAYVPIGYIPDYFYTTEELCDEYQIVLPEDGFTIAEMADLMSGYLEREQKPLFNTSGWFMMDYAEQFIDYENKTANFDSEEFRNGLRVAKRIADNPNEAYFSDDLLDQTVLGKTGGRWSYSEPLSRLRVFGNDLEELSYTPKIYGIKASDGNSYTASATYCFAINANSEQKEEAYQILKQLLGETTQNDQFFSSVFGIPVLNSAADALLAEAQEPWPEGRSNALVPLSEEVADSFQKIIDGIGNCRMFDMAWVIDIMQQPYQDYLDGKITEDQLIQTIQQKTNLALKE